MKEAKIITRQIPLRDTSGKEIDKIKLPKVLCETSVNRQLLYSAVLMYETNLGNKLAATKTRSKVRGGGAKPWRQKGTGRARVGSNRNPLWRGGGVVFGPSARNSHYSISKRAKLQALKNSIIDKLNVDGLIILDKLKIDKPKTKLLLSILMALKINEKALLLLSKPDQDILLAARNLPYLEVKLAQDVNAYDVLRFRKLIATNLGFQKLIDRIK